MTTRVALVGGPMYDQLYSLLGDDVDVVVHADHPTLNRAVADLLGRGERLDLISTHGKYAPSQARWLRPLGDLVDPATITAVAPRALELCSYRGELLCMPRNIDVRVLWWRTDVLDAPPATWDDVDASPHAFGFTGRESGLFGLFYELLVASGSDVFEVSAEGVRPTLDGPPAVDAVELLQRLCAKAPADLPQWHYDDVDRALLDGRVAMAAAWPGGTNSIRRSSLSHVLAPAPYPGGCSYSGCHGWAIPTTCGDLALAVQLIERLSGLEAAGIEAASGAIPARLDALDALDALDSLDERLAITRRTIDTAMLTYPPLERFPEIEDAAWGAIHDALMGRIDAEAAVVRMQEAAEEVLR